jgi:hypothetical protein
MTISETHLKILYKYGGPVTMIQIITGDKGKGKTKVLIDKVNNDVKVVSGSVVFIDNNNKHVYELSNRVHMINSTHYEVNNLEMFKGFILGIISQNKDIERIYIDNFSTVTFTEAEDVKEALDAINDISSRHNISIVLCFATDSSDVPEEYKDNIIASL